MAGSAAVLVGLALGAWALVPATAGAAPVRARGAAPTSAALAPPGVHRSGQRLGGTSAGVPGGPPQAPGRPPAGGSAGPDGGATAAAAVGTAAGTPTGPLPAPQNLLTGTQSAFDGTTGGWSAAKATVSWVASPALSAAGSLEVTATSDQNCSAWSGLPGHGGLTPASAGTLYAGWATVQATDTSLVVAPAVAFFDASGNPLTVVWGQGMQATTGSWTALAPAAGIAPPGTVAVAVGIVVYSTTPGPALDVAAPWLTGTTIAGQPPVHGPLHVSGNRIVDGSGHPVVLRGVVMNELEASAHVSWLTQATVAQARQWGANVVRVPLGEQLWLTSSCDYDPGYVQAVDQVVGWITSLGMVALLDLHYGAVGTGCPPAGPQLMADAPNSVTFWSQVAARYAANPLVAFDLFNEPHDISDAVWLSGGWVTAGPAPFQAAGMQQLYDAVRGAGARNLVVVSGNDWANTPPATLLHGTDIAYAVHVYTCPGSSLASCSGPNPDDPSPILSQWRTLAGQVPVLVTEFGWPSAYDGTYNANVIAYANAQGWGWTAFTWVAPNTGPWSLVASAIPGGPAEPTPAGIPVLRALASAG